MGFIINAIFFLISFATLAVAGGFATDSARRTTTINNYDNNELLISAHQKLTIAAVITWITIAVLITLVVLLIIFGGPEAANWLNWIIYGFLILTLGAVAAVGILSAWGASQIQQAEVPDDNLSRRNAIIAAVLAIVGFVAVVVILLIRIFSGGEEEEETDVTSQLTSIAGLFS